jgi:hypothetical protein
VIIPLVTHGITLMSRLQLWTQPLWIVLLVLPYAVVLWKQPSAFADFRSFAGRAEDGAGFELLLFCSAATVAFSPIAQIGEQVLGLHSNVAIAWVGALVADLVPGEHRARERRRAGAAGAARRVPEGVRGTGAARPAGQSARDSRCARCRGP